MYTIVPDDFVNTERKGKRPASLPNLEELNKGEKRMCRVDLNYSTYVISCFSKKKKF